MSSEHFFYDDEDRLDGSHWADSIGKADASIPKPAIASHYLQHLRALIKVRKQQGSRSFNVVLYCRESTYDQVREGNLDDQHEEARRLIATLGRKLDFNLVIKADVVGPRHEHGWHKDRPSFKKAVRLAKKYKAVIVGLSTCRFVRNRHYHKEGSQPTKRDFENLRRLARGVPLATIDDPDRPSEEVRSQQTLRGLKKPKQPRIDRRIYRPRLTQAEKDKIKRLRNRDYSLGRLAEMFDRPRSTIRSICQQKS